MPDRFGSPSISTEMIEELRSRAKTTRLRALRALRQAGGDIDEAERLLNERRTMLTEPSYGTELTRALSQTPGYAAGYREAQRQVQFGRQLKSIREARGLSQMKLAELSNVDQGDISRFEAGKWGKRGISFEMLERILPVLGYRLEHRIVPLKEEEKQVPELAAQAADTMTGLLSP